MGETFSVVLAHPEPAYGNAGLMAWWLLVWAIVIVAAIGVAFWKRGNRR